MKNCPNVLVHTSSLTTGTVLNPLHFRFGYKLNSESTDKKITCNSQLGWNFLTNILGPLWTHIDVSAPWGHFKLSDLTDGELFRITRPQCLSEGAVGSAEPH